MKPITVMISIVKGSRTPKIDPPPNKTSTIIDAKATGTDIKKLNFKASFCSYFSKSIAEIVNPEREMPGNIENP